MKLIAEVVGKKVYVHHPDGFTVARLCRISGEVNDRNAPMGVCLTIKAENFSAWSKRVSGMWKFKVPARLRPSWDKESS